MNGSISWLYVFSINVSIEFTDNRRAGGGGGGGGEGGGRIGVGESAGPGMTG